MIKDAIKYIVGLSEPNIKEIRDEVYSDKPLHRISFIPKAEPIKLNTLASLVDYIKSDVDYMAEKMIIHIQSPTHIELYSQLYAEREREKIAVVDALIPEFRFNQFMDHESFCIALQSKCTDEGDTDLALLLKFAGTVEAGTVAQYGDDGVTQKATVKTGVTSKEAAIVPSPAILKPYRTFVDVEQPKSSFIFRMKQDKYDAVQCALFEADGGAWKLTAMQTIKDYLDAELSEMSERFVVIA